MDLMKAAGAPIVLTIGAQAVTFPRLTMTDVAEMLALIVNERRERLVKTMDECKITGQARFAELKAFDADIATIATALRWAMTPTGIVVTIARSLQKLNPSVSVAQVAALDLDANQMDELSLRLWGFKLAPAEEQPNPLAKAQPTGPSNPPLSVGSTTAPIPGA